MPTTPKPITGTHMTFEANGVELPARMRAQLDALILPGTDYVHLLSFEKHGRIGCRCTAISRTNEGRWCFIVATWRQLFGTSSRVTAISDGTARTLMSQQAKMGTDAANTAPLGGGLISPLAG